MVAVDDFWKVLKENNYFYFSGVPCNCFSDILNQAFKDPDITYVPAVRENVALGIASGAYLAGKKSGIFLQNSGLGNITNALTSFSCIYKIPVLMFISWRGYQGHDAPEHIIMGEKLLDLLKVFEIPAVILSDEFNEEIRGVIKVMESRLTPAAIIIRKGVVQ